MGPLQPILVTGLCADQHVLGCSSSSKTKVEGKKDNGLYTRHVYSLLKVMILGSGLVFFVFFGKDGYEESCKHEDFLSFYKLLRDVSWTRQRSSSMIQRWGPKPWMMETQWIWSTCGILGDTRNGMAIGLIKVMIPAASGRRWIWMIDFLMFACVFLRKLFKHHLHGFLINFPFSGKRRWPGFYSRHARLPGEPWIG